MVDYDGTTHTLPLLPLALWVEAVDDQCIMIVERNSFLPLSRLFLVTTQIDGQLAAELRLLQGESDRASGNKAIATFEISGLEERQAGSINVNALLHIRASGDVICTAQDSETGNKLTVLNTAGPCRVYCEGPLWMGCTPDKWIVAASDHPEKYEAESKLYLSGMKNNSLVKEMLGDNYDFFVKNGFNSEAASEVFQSYLAWQEQGWKGTIIHLLNRRLECAGGTQYQMSRHIITESDLVQLFQIDAQRKDQKSGDSIVIATAFAELIVRARIDYRIRQFAVDAVLRESFMISLKDHVVPDQRLKWLELMNRLLDQVIADG